MTLLLGWSHATETDPSADYGRLPAGLALEDAEWGADRGRRVVAACTVKVLRSRAKGNPDSAVRGAWAKHWSAEWWVCQLLNEPNLNEHADPRADVEGFRGGPAEHADWLRRAIRVAGPGARIGYTPMSPGVSGWERWLDDETIALCGGLIGHVYGDAERMWTDLQPVLAKARLHNKSVVLGEVGPAWGDDALVWGTEQLPGFADQVAREAPEVVALSVFAPSWPRPDGIHTEPLRFLGTDVDRWLREWTPPEPDATPPEVQPVDYAKALWRPSPNYTPGRGGEKVIAEVVHITEGGGQQSLDWLRNPASQVSSTYLILEDGTAVQLVREGDTPWTNGIDFDLGYAAYKSNLSIPWVKRCWDRRINPNRVTITIEVAGRSGRPITAKQKATLFDLTADIARRHESIPRVWYSIGEHAWTDGVNRPHCPGAAMPMDELRAHVFPTEKPKAPPAPSYQVGEGIRNWLRDNPDAGLPRHDSYYDLYGNEAVWLDASKRYPTGGLLVARKWLDWSIRVLSWD